MGQLHVSDYARRVELLSSEEVPKNAEAGPPVRSEGSSSRQTVWPEHTMLQVHLTKCEIFNTDVREVQVHSVGCQEQISKKHSFEHTLSLT